MDETNNGAEFTALCVYLHCFSLMHSNNTLKKAAACCFYWEKEASHGLTQTSTFCWKTMALW